MNKLKMLFGVVGVVVLASLVVLPFVMNEDEEKANVDEVVENVDSVEKEVGERKTEVKFKEFDDNSLEVSKVETSPEKEEVEEEGKVTEETKKEEVKEEKKNDKVVVEEKNESNKKTVAKEPVKKEESKKEVKSNPVTTTKNVTETESIPFKTVSENDSTLEKGKTKVVQEGQNGVKTITYQETYVDGKFSSKKIVSEKVTKNPVNKIVKVGTKEEVKPEPPSSNYGNVETIYKNNGYGFSERSSGGFVATKNGVEVHSYNGNKMFMIKDPSTIGVASSSLNALGVPLSTSKINQILNEMVNSFTPSVSESGVKFEFLSQGIKVTW